MTGFDLVTHIIPWLLTVCALSFTLYNIIHNNKKEEKERTKDYATEITKVNVKLDNLQASANSTNGMVNSLDNKLENINTKVENIDKRLVAVETKMEM